MVIMINAICVLQSYSGCSRVSQSFKKKKKSWFTTVTAKPTCGWFKTFPKKTYLTLIAVRSCFVLSLARVDCWHSSSGFLPQGKPCWWLLPHRAVKKRRFQFKLRELEHRRGTVRTWVSFLRDQTPSRPRSIFINFLCFSFFSWKS